MYSPLDGTWFVRWVFAAAILEQESNVCKWRTLLTLFGAATVAYLKKWQSHRVLLLLTKSQVLIKVLEKSVQFKWILFLHDGPLACLPPLNVLSLWCSRWLQAGNITVIVGGTWPRCFPCYKSPAFIWCEWSSSLPRLFVLNHPSWLSRNTRLTHPETTPPLPTTPAAPPHSSSHFLCVKPRCFCFQIN